MAVIFDFIRDIAAFAVLSGLVGIISPNRYKKYINLCLGIMLISLMLKPINAVFALFENDAPNIATFDDFYDNALYQGDYDGAAIADNYAKALSENLRLFAETALSEYEYVSSEFSTDCSPSSENFGAILGLELILRGKPTEKPFIRAEKPAADVEKAREKEINSIKKSISDFYNLSQDNINVIVQS